MAKAKRRSDGRYIQRVPIGKKDGRAIYKTIYAYTLDSLNEKALNLQLQKKQGINISASGDSFEDWSKRWLILKKTAVSDSRYVTCESHLKHLMPYIGDFPISKVETVDIQDIVLELSLCNPNTGKPSSKNLMESVKNVASQIFELTIENKILVRNPAKYVRIPDVSREVKRRALTEEEQGWIINTPHRAKRSSMIMMFAGLRRGELIPLTWNDINLEKKTIIINKSVEKIKGKFCLKQGAKTLAGIRIISLPDVLVDFLREEPKESIYVSISSKNQMHTESSWKRMWKSYMTDLNIIYGDFSFYKEKYKDRPNQRPSSKNDPLGVPIVIPSITPHWLRHTYATMLYFAGVDILTAKELMGHSDIKTTLGIYTHLDQTHKIKNINKLNEYLKKEDATNEKKNA